MAVASASGLLSRPSRALTLFRGLSLLAAVSTFGLVILGAVVRVTGSGLGCPDWPLCHGGVLPPWELQAVIEYSHRIVASVLVGPLVLATAVVAWISYRRERWAVLPATLALVLVLAQALLGGATVLNELPGSIVAAHLALGEASLACLILVSVVAHRGPLRVALSPGPLSEGTSRRPDRFPILILAAAAGVYGILISGSIVTVTNATTACLDWPLCQGDVFPEQRLAAIHMGHRMLVVIIGLFVLYVLHKGFRPRHQPSHIRLLSMAVAALFAVQVMVGAATVWLTFPVEYRALHMAIATAVWGSIVVLGLVTYTQSRHPSHSRHQLEEQAHA